MRNVLIGFCLVGLAGCATVSMVPGQATVETDLTETQSALRKSSDAYCETARDAGWVAETDGIFGLARILMHGQDAGEETPKGYAASIGAETDPVETVFSRIAADAQTAREGLAAVASEARALLVSNDEAGRGDIKSFELSLLSAQDAHRNFARAADMTVARAGSAPADVDLALAAFADEIDSARKTADALADKFAAVDRAVS